MSDECVRVFPGRLREARAFVVLGCVFALMLLVPLIEQSGLVGLLGVSFLDKPPRWPVALVFAALAVAPYLVLRRIASQFGSTLKVTGDTVVISLWQSSREVVIPFSAIIRTGETSITALIDGRERTYILGMIMYKREWNEFLELISSASGTHEARH